MSSLARDYQEKRDYIRMQVSTPATLKLNDGSSYELICMNLSSNGAQLSHSKPVAINQVGRLIIASGGGSTQNLEAEVTVCRSQEVGTNAYHIGLTINRYL
ncbi:MAG: hypothetical protein RL217_873 [Pseudomonadota bacterium]|jgi:hypothetical protein